MKSLFKFSVTTASVLFASTLLTSVYANHEQPAGKVYAAAVDDCTVIKQISLSDNEAAAYYALKVLEKKITAIQLPLHGVEQTLEEYSDEMEQISRLAIQETEQTLYMDKELLKEQEGIADKIQALMALHQADFDAIGELGSMMSEKADVFGETIKDAFEDLQHHHVKVFSEGESPLPEQCSNPNLM